jgi:hypothetical protein
MRARVAHQRVGRAPCLGTGSIWFAVGNISARWMTRAQIGVIYNFQCHLRSSSIGLRNRKVPRNLLRQRCGLSCEPILWALLEIAERKDGPALALHAQPSLKNHMPGVAPTGAVGSAAVTRCARLTRA